MGQHANAASDYDDVYPPPPAGIVGYLKRHPVGFWFIFWGELAERCAFYGIRTLLFVYLTAVLAFSTADATSMSYAFKAACYLSPLLGAYLADRFFGKYWIIVGFSLPYIAGMLLMSLETRLGLYLGLGLLALGAGAIKPNLSTLMGMTYDERRPGDAKIRGDAFYMFYFAINLGAVISSTLLPVVAKKDGMFSGYEGYPVGFLITAGLMALALTLFAAGKRHYAKEVVHDRVPLTDAERAEQWKVLGRIGGLFLLVAVWWFAYEMKDNLWIAFARDRIDLDVPYYGVIQPNQLLGLNPFLILVLVPTLNLFWKLVDRDGTRFSSPRKMLFGFVLMALTYLLMASAGFLSADGSRVSIGWMVAAFFVMTVSEVMVSVIGLELAFRAAPPRMKSLVTACWLLSVFLGNLIGIAVAKLDLYTSQGPGPFFAGLAVLMLLTAVAFSTVGNRFQRTAG